MKKLLKITLLKSLYQCDGEPMPQAALIGAARIGTSGNPTNLDIESAIKDLEADGYLAGLTDDITGVSWSLTEKGKFRAVSLR